MLLGAPDRGILAVLVKNGRISNAGLAPPHSTEACAFSSASASCATPAPTSPLSNAL
ncbi:hypothetical protein [Streptomyces sp. RKAG293]|uniref:hypothetical protein n=1 Tax=Streptomyces sp. RKAG293 TaxID=2893403 RepID=UPI002033B39A|nr:hypothetical protein [Streptomyces sp. RKAG293]MCM2418122.1 hypothetical protein [Streptomyces sp. RKAG293]